MPVDGKLNRTALLLHGLFEAGYRFVKIKEDKIYGTRVEVQPFLTDPQTSWGAPKIWQILTDLGFPWSCASFALLKGERNLFKPGIYRPRDFEDTKQHVRSGATLITDPPAEVKKDVHLVSEDYATFELAEVIKV